MKQSRFTEEQIILALRQQESREKTVAEVSRELEQENARLKRIVANLTLDKEILQEVLKKL